jgi:uncharacterized protein YdiU (UPF0061 family)
MPTPLESLLQHSAFLSLGKDFYTSLQPTPLPHASWVAISPELANTLGLNSAFKTDEVALKILTGIEVPSSMKPYAAVYSGHQFGVWAGQLGDGRAITLGQINAQDQSWELQLKGAGPTPYSRMGDGRAVLRSSIREFLCSEAMHGLGIPTTRALAITQSPAQVIRESIENAAVVTRVAPSFIRFGQFEHFASNGMHDQLKELTDFVIARFYPEALQHEKPYLYFFELVLKRSAKLVAQWQSVGFCHGVLNTDNMSILGLTLDYGPFGFLDKFALNHICNHTDSQGRYSFANQPQVFYWNLLCLAQALLPIMTSDDSDEAMEQTIEQIKPILTSFTNLYLKEYQVLMSRKLGFDGDTSEQSLHIIQELIQLLDKNAIDYTYFFRNLSRLIQDPQRSLLKDHFIDTVGYDRWMSSYIDQLRIIGIDPDLVIPKMNQVNPKYILRQHLAQMAITQSQLGDHTMVQNLQQCLSHPFEEQPEFEEYATLPPEWANHLEVSCSS